MRPLAVPGRLGGAYVEGVADALALHRILWKQSFEPPFPPGKPEHDFRRIPLARFDEALRGVRSSVRKLMRELEKRDVVRRRDPYLLFHPDLLHPIKAARFAVGNVKPEPDLRYFVLRDIRFRYGRHLASSTAKLLHGLARATNALATSMDVRHRSPQHRLEARRFRYREVFLPTLEGTLETAASSSTDSIAFFVEVCAAVNYLKPHFNSDFISLRTSTVDAEYLLSSLFGLTTAIEGFDDLFGGGGAVLAEAFGPPPGNQHDEEWADEQSIWGRTLLIEGQSGTGKSMLSLQLAVEVARKGGLVWIESLEQSAEECLYALEAIQALPSDGSVVVVTRTPDATSLLESRTAGVGGIIILRGEKRSFRELLDNLVMHADRMKNYPIRLIVVDPINSVIREEDESPVQLRARTLKAIEAIKRLRTNLCLIAEENSGVDDDLWFETNIADVVVRLSVGERHNYAQRYIAVRKSRLQREQRGEHPFYIVAGEGISIYPSPAAFLNKIQSRSFFTGHSRIVFGIPALDDVLGPAALYSGDVIVLQGPSGTYKTPFGISFLLGRDRRRHSGSRFKANSLWVMVRDTVSTAERMLSSELVRPERGGKTIDDIRLCPLPAEHVQPGYILARILAEIENARRENVHIDRVMIDDVTHWELSSPFVRDDDTFADTLVELLQRQAVTALFTCSQIAPRKSSVLEASIVDRADCVLEFDRREFMGAQRVQVRVQNSRGMRHRRDALEVKLGNRGLQLGPTSSLVRVDAQGNVSAVQIRLLLHGETQAQVEYQSGLRDALRAVLSKHVYVEPRNVHMQSMLSLSGLSVVEEAQVLQVDEFELPRLLEKTREGALLYRFASDSWAKEWNDIFPALRERGRREDGSFLALPYYCSFSILAHRSRAFPSGTTPSWQELAAQCQQWERDNSGPDELFFDFPRGRDEHYNCLFLEILESIQPERKAFDGSCRFRERMGSTAAIEAGLILRQLCRRAYLLDVEGTHLDDRLGYQIVTFRKAEVWRLWYSMLSELARVLPVGERDEVQVTSLPGGVSVAGEWYLAVPAYSSAPEVTLEIMQMLTHRDAEMERLRRGVGLPIRSSYYEEPDNGAEAATTAITSLELPRGMVAGLMKTAIRRSRFACYAQYTGSLAHYIRQIIEIPDRPEDELRRRVELLLRGFQQSVSKTTLPFSCAACRQ